MLLSSDSVLLNEKRKCPLGQLETVADLRSTLSLARSWALSFLVGGRSAQTERVPGRPFFMVTGSMSRDAVLTLHLTQ